jgi:hypothetical protein
MSRQPRRALALALAGTAVLASAAVALAASPVKGASYTGATLRGQRPITLKVSRNGKTVTANLVSPPLYCQGGGPPETQITKPASIQANGSFSGSIIYQYQHKTSFKARFSGKFSGRKVTGTVRSEYTSSSCSGSTSFSAKAG